MEWDTVNWSRAVSFWNLEDKVRAFGTPECLDIGARGGGLSLLLATCGANVVCSDLTSPGRISGSGTCGKFRTV